MRLFFFSFSLFFLFLAPGNAQPIAVKNKTEYPFWIQMPKNYNTNEKQPLLIFLHGKSLSGTDLNKVKRYGVLRAIEKGRNIPAIVVAPQLAKGSWNPDKVLEVIDFVKKNYNISNSQIYVCGMSLGGYGTLHFAGKHPDKITAAVAICGGGNTKDACQLAKLPLWIQHGEIDYIVPMSESIKITEAIKKCNENAPVTLTLIKGGNHSNVERLFHQDELYNWLFNQKKEE
ncbi:MAG: alpha/beta hydrolase-fold protein [Flavobacterium sp.]|jgi:predicted peptidase|nr:alpha/beta hydrolase-fold protein [Flavobacterium sp.]